MVELIADEEGSLATPTKSAYPGNFLIQEEPEQ